MVTTTNRSLAERVRDQIQGRHGNDEMLPESATERGTMLIDLIIGMAIFLILAYIGFSALSQQRERAYEQTAASDAQQLVTEIESYNTDTQTYPAAITLDPATKAYKTDAVDTAAHYSRGMSVEAYNLDAATNTFTFCLVHTSGSKKDAFASYNSVTGQVKSGRSIGGAAVTCSYN